MKKVFDDLGRSFIAPETPWQFLGGRVLLTNVNCGSGAVKLPPIFGRSQ